MEKILILHGWGIGSRTWAQTKEILEGAGYETIIPDLPGFGNNPPPETPWTIDDYASWVNAFCEKNNLSQFFLLGHSFGGGISVKFLEKFPGKTKALILVAAKLHRQKSWMYYFGLVLAKIGNMIFSIPGLSHLRSFARKILYRALGVRDYYKLEMEKTNTMKKTFKEVVGKNLIPLLGSVKIPTLIIWGDKDEMTPLSDAYLVQKAIPMAELETIKGGKHALHMQCPAELAKIVLKFLQKQ